jgi:hypothetical protein
LGPVRNLFENLEENPMRIQGIVVTFVFVAMLAASEASACSNATLNGAYGYHHGRVGGPGNPTTVVGQIIADGLGNLSGSYTLSRDGNVSTGTFTGTYSISKNCTGTLSLSSEDNVPADFNIFLDDGNKGFQMIQTDYNFDQPGFALARGTGTCGLSGKQQTLATNLATLFPDPESAVGQLVLDGYGNITGNEETFDVEFANFTLSVTGTYTEGADCTGTMQIIPAGETASNFNTVSVNDGKELLLIETDPGTLLTGTAQQ